MSNKTQQSRPNVPIGVPRYKPIRPRPPAQPPLPRFRGLGVFPHDGSLKGNVLLAQHLCKPELERHARISRGCACNECFECACRIVLTDPKRAKQITGF